MNFLEIFKGTISTLKSNKLRTILTMLGIIIGIASVITMWSIGVGGRENVLGDLKKIGYGKFTVSIDYKSEKFKYKDYFSNATLNLLKESGKFKNIAIGIEERFRTKKGNIRKFSYADISTADFEKISPVEILVGRNFLPFEYEKNERVITLDNSSAKKLFGSEKKAIGEILEISRFRTNQTYNYKIIGVFRSPYEAFDKLFADEDMPVILRMPYKTYNQTFNSNLETFDSIIIEAKDPNKLAESMNEAKRILEFYKNTNEVYITRAISNDIESFDKILSTLSIFITLAASISLFVGGIGVMNIMLVTVVERTKEIGIRKALGAKNRDILKQFLFESVILTLLGGLIGIVLGFILGLLAGKIVGIKPVFSIFSIILSMSISVIVGVVFGVSPARKAAKLNPIDALRTE
ncbi:MAG: ABC transporter permease [Fusobacterium sp.]|uniref:ABC transporter permease n=1 Tax=Fusobacterium sp. TaxID=68766 RepID=UPI0026DCC92B|nr:ABC transporter permease [Fusobacterium sp.]MDO4690482.1 ABC transporter permease [Fusobacterium sp.]